MRDVRIVSTSETLDGPAAEDDIISGDLPALAVQGLSKRLTGRAVLRNVDFEIDVGQLVLLRGGNGSGKTTLLRCLAGSWRADSGEVLWFGVPHESLEPKSRRILGVVAHQSLVYPDLTARENLCFAARMYGLPAPTSIASRWIERADLTRWADHPAARLSQGTRQRLAIARGLLHDPLIVLLDEPFTALDDASRAWFVELLIELRTRGRSIVFTTHAELPHERIIDRVLELRDGRAFECDRPRGDFASARRAA